MNKNFHNQNISTILGLLLLNKAKQGSHSYERPIKLLEDALMSSKKPRLGAYYYIQLGDALSRTKQHARADELFKVI